MSLYEMTCRELVEVVTAYVDGTLSDVARGRFEEHVMECEGCRAYLDQMRRTIELTGKLTEDGVPQPARDALLRAFRGWRRA